MRDISKLSGDLKSIGKNADNVVLANLYSAAESVRGEAVKSIQERKFGRAVVRYTPSGSRYDHVSAPSGGAPNTDTGTLVKSIIAQKRLDHVVVGSSEAAPYGKWLEVGNEKGQSWPWLMPAFEKMLPTIREKLKRIGADLKAVSIK